MYGDEWDDSDEWDEDGSRPYPGFATYDGGMRQYRCGGSTEEMCDDISCRYCGPSVSRPRPERRQRRTYSRYSDSFSVHPMIPVPEEVQEQWAARHVDDYDEDYPY